MPVHEIAKSVTSMFFDLMKHVDGRLEIDKKDKERPFHALDEDGCKDKEQHPQNECNDDPAWSVRCGEH